MVDGVLRLPAGHLLEFKPGAPEPRLSAYWQLPGPASATSPASMDSLADQLSDLLSSAVAEQLHADVPLGVLLSGGVDSSLVTAIAARVHPGAVRTFTVTFPGAPHLNESGFARQVAQHCGTTHSELPVEEPAYSLVEKIGRALGEPMGDSSVIPTYLVSRRIREEATVAVGGDGGDELFGGYLHHALIQRDAARLRLLPGARPEGSRRRQSTCFLSDCGDGGGSFRRSGAPMRRSATAGWPARGSGPASWPPYRPSCERPVRSRWTGIGGYLPCSGQLGLIFGVTCPTTFWPRWIVRVC